MRGVYAIVNRETGKFYIGSAIDVCVRWNSHRSALRSGRHVNRHLQAAWNKYGVDAFVCVLVEEVAEAAELVAREQAWLDQSEASTVGYNLSPTAGNTLGYRFSPEQLEALQGKAKSPEHRANLWRDRVVTDEHRARMARLGRRSAGRAKSAEHRAAIGRPQRGSANHRAKLSEAAVVEIKERLVAGETGRRIAAEFDVCEPTISSIKHGKSWSHVA